jgi:hypothetical protein
VDPKTRTATATASYFRPLEKLVIIRNGEVIAAVRGDGRRLKLTASAPVAGEESCWVASRVAAQRAEAGPDIQAHTNPVYLLRQAAPVMVRKARESVAREWESQVAWYKSTPMVFREEAHRREFLERLGETTRRLQP